MGPRQSQKVAPHNGKILQAMFWSLLGPILGPTWVTSGSTWPVHTNIDAKLPFKLLCSSPSRPQQDLPTATLQVFQWFLGSQNLQKLLVCLGLLCFCKIAFMPPVIPAAALPSPRSASRGRPGPPRRAKEGPRWPRMGPRWAQTGPPHSGKILQDNSWSPLEPILGPPLAIWGSTWPIPAHLEDNMASKLLSSSLQATNKTSKHPLCRFFQGSLPPLSGQTH